MLKSIIGYKLLSPDQQKKQEFTEKVLMATIAMQAGEIASIRKHLQHLDNTLYQEKSYADTFFEILIYIFLFVVIVYIYRKYIKNQYS